MEKPQIQIPRIPTITPVIAFLDVDSFECQIWQREEPSTRGKPCVVANMSGRIVAVTYEAKAFGVSRIETPTVIDAIRKCPFLHIFQKPDKWGKQDQSKPRKTTWEIVSCIQDFLDKFSGGDVTLEVASSDEIYLDISSEISRGIENREARMGGRPDIPFPETVVWERKKQTKPGPFNYRLPVETRNTNEFRSGLIKNKMKYSYKNEERLMFGALFLNQLCLYVEQTTGLHVSGGVARNKLLAKVGCSLHKPRKVTVMFDEAFRRVSGHIPATSIPGLGGEKGKQLKEKFGVETLGDVCKIGYDKLEEEFGKETAQKFWSWATGKDVEPVVNKITKDQIQLNKPRGDIHGYDRLNKVLRNLTEEMQLLLEEEKTRYQRTTEQVLVKFQLENPKGTNKNGNSRDGGPDSTNEANQMGSELFDIVDPNGHPLPARILQFFKELPNAARPNYICLSALTFVLRNFVTLNSLNGLCTPMEEMVISDKLTQPQSLPSTLRVITKGLSWLSSSSKPVFQHTLVGSFRITSDLKYSTDAKLPKLVDDAKLQSIVGYYFLRDYNPDTSCLKLIQDYPAYDDLKHEYFGRWLQKQKPQIEGLEDVRFVAAQGRLLRAMKTPINKTFGEWETYGMNVDNVIYLWDEKTPRAKEIFTRPETYYMGELFEHLATGRWNMEGSNEVLDGMQNVFLIQKVTFGKHKLLLLNDVDAEDSEGNFIQISQQLDKTCYQNDSLILERETKLWGQAIVSGSKKVVIGNRNRRNVITKIDTILTEDYGSNIERKDSCLIFLNRVLDWIEGHLKIPNKNLVKKFSWIPGNPVVNCTTIQENEIKKLLAPRLYFAK